ncbi:hypothetical protein CRG98_027316 [Punica granatum]|uniref:Uncharacterized protein n=1 Tax=Punica granatum TaxID=22663 RepID=A0A2I0J7R7_PUNGR|nr:hypothetical protein CRG98_027316 [Punica granatum]
MTAQSAELASGKAQSFLSSKAGFQQLDRNAVHLANPPSKRSCTPQVHWVGVFEPCSSFGMRPVHVANPSGQSRLLFCTGVNPLRANPDYFFAPGSIPFGSIPTTFLHRGQFPSGQS